MTCETCHGEGRVKVGWSPAPKSKIGIRAEYDPCPACTPPPHTFWAKKIGAQIAGIRERATA